MFSLTNQIALVTGAARGNGAAIAKGLAKAGAHVVVVDLQKKAATETAELIRAQGGLATAYALDVSDAQACERVAQQVRKDVGPVSILVNNAGVYLRDSGVGAANAVEDWRTTFAVNVNGSFFVTRAFLSDLRKTKGSVVNVASVASFVGSRDSAAYPASKGAVAQLTKTLAMELAKDGIRVNAIAPGIIRTQMTEITRNNDQALEKFLTHVPMSRVAEPEELVGPVIFLSSTAASYVTGAILPVDGGYLTV